MRCSECQFENPDNAWHCYQCGAVLNGKEVPDLSGLPQDVPEMQAALHRLRRFVPSAVADAVLYDQKRLRGERREVAILFADAVNFTHLAESLDAESVFNLINDLLGRLVTCIHRYGGTVDKFTGDGLMAVFGAPIAHENSSELAVRAALDMQQAAAGFEPVAMAQLGAPLKMRIGIHSGPAVAGILGTEQQAAYTIIGNTVNMASRIESLAQPGHVWVSERVYQHTRALFEFQAMGTVEIKGISDPVAAYEVLGDHAVPMSVRGVSGVTSRFLGRDAELEQLHDMVSAFLDDAYGRLIVVRGEAGMGKSRLIQEGIADFVGERAQIWHGRGLPYAQGVGYGLFRSLLQDALHDRLHNDEWEEAVPPGLRPFLRQVLMLPVTPDEQETLHHLGPELVKQMTSLAVREWLQGEARSSSIVLILDDVHWADDLSRDMLQSLIGLSNEASILFCAITRPHPELKLDTEPDPLQPIDEIPGPRSLWLDLQPLSQAHCRELLGHLVDLEGMPATVIETILSRSEGAPFYIEEFVRMLIEKEVLELSDGQWRVTSTMSLKTIEIPTTLRGLMMARVDRLPENLQDVLRDAAVIGLQFSMPLLEAVERQLRGPVNIVPALERLHDLGLLVKRSQADEKVYAFRHILTQETIYRSLLRSERPSLHHAVATAIETVYAHQAESQIEVLAFHYDLARVYDKAMHYMLLSGDRARSRFANHEAIDYYERTLQLSQHLSGHGQARWRAAIGLGEVETHIGEYEEAVACYQAAMDEWSGAAPEDRAMAMLKMAQVWDKRGNQDEIERWLHQARRQLGNESSLYPALYGEIYSELGWLNLRRGNLDDAQQWLEQGLDLVSGTEHYGVLSSILNRLGALHYHRGEWKQAAARVKGALELREKLGDLVGYARSLNNLGILQRASGDWDGALTSYERAVEMNERLGGVEGAALARTNLGVLYTNRGEWDKAEENLQHSFTTAQRIAHPYELAQAHMNLGRLYLLQRRWGVCTEHLNAALPLYEEAGARANLNLCDAYWVTSLLFLEQDDIGTATRWAERVYALLCEVSGADSGDSVEWGRYEQLMGRLAQAEGDLEAAHTHLARSAAVFEANHSLLEAGQTAYWRGQLALSLTQIDEAAQQFEAARQLFEKLGAAADLARVKNALAEMDTA
ncbi:MAG: tetratricopeptide repeat protein [Anaerolineae bacterium]|nr:tetratricopeptide repeat protein [Anaerolineae bacterium]